MLFDNPAMFKNFSALICELPRDFHNHQIDVKTKGRPKYLSRELLWVPLLAVAEELLPVPLVVLTSFIEHPCSPARQHDRALSTLSHGTFLNRSSPLRISYFSVMGNPHALCGKYPFDFDLSQGEE